MDVSLTIKVFNDFVKLEINLVYQQKNKIKNRGTGAGGFKTNKNGLSYEKITDLSNEYKIIKQSKHSCEIKFNLYDSVSFIAVQKNNLFKYMHNRMNLNINKAHGCKSPDECFINEYKKIIFIIEKKFQQTSGSACEKIQTSDFKYWQYKRTFPSYNIVYMYCLSEWFKENCKAEIEYLQFKKVPLFYGNSKQYKKDIIKYIINY